MTQESFRPGLEGVVAGETAISTIDGDLLYRGYAVEDLARHSSFEECAWLLLHGDLPTRDELRSFRERLHQLQQSLAPGLLEILRQLPATGSMMDVMRTGASLIGQFDPDAEATGGEADQGKAERLLAQMPIVLAATHRMRCGAEPVPARPDLTFAANLLWMIHGAEPRPQWVEVMDDSLIMYAEHEFNASTFTARVVASTLSDLYSAVVAGIGALKGSLHGGANERVLEVLQSVGGPDRAESWVREALQKKVKIMGFGHRVYKEGDPRARYLKPQCQTLARAAGDESLEQIAEVIEQAVWSAKQIPPNLDWPSARLYHYLQLPVDLYTPLFVVSRITGWSAHVMEQLGNNRIFRPRSQYTGQPRRSYSAPGE